MASSNCTLIFDVRQNSESKEMVECKQAVFKHAAFLAKQKTSEELYQILFCTFSNPRVSSEYSIKEGKVLFSSILRLRWNYEATRNEV